VRAPSPGPEGFGLAGVEGAVPPLLGLTEGAGLLPLGVTGGASLPAVRSAVASGESCDTVAGAGTTMVGIGLSSLVRWKRIATSVAIVPMTTVDTPAIASIERAPCAGLAGRPGGGRGMP
jgi:hypothetical protein